MSTENRMGNFQASQSKRASNEYDFLKIHRERENKYGGHKLESSAKRLNDLKNRVMQGVLNINQELINRGIAPPASYLEDAYFSNSNE